MTDFPFAIVGFDLDGTLVDTHADLGVALNHALRLAGRAEVPAGQVRDLIGGGARQMLDRALAITGGPLPEAEVQSLHADLVAFYRANIAVHSRLFPGGEEMLAALEARGVRLAVVTNKLESLAVRLLEELGLAPRLAAIIGGDTLGPGRAKPAPDLLHEMVARLGGGKAAYVGDTSFDTRAAQAAGLPCVAVRFGFADAPLESLGADAVIDHFEELLPALEHLAARRALA
ncbi:HAD-IA family hydrolase [Novosphingobium flavum]|uniref:Phosphoglycolate phosphatase n=1 Tax=Novosphingobium flavum TaxID=1778672 RepID=A0A7X1KMS5_9SPHN|nr:HAD-IA family hydrolase [Novosphingobium flavum]MBC2666600.1 HAD-IA family hydrolase [Novosphingobium flavum]